MSIANVRKWRNIPFLKRGMRVLHTHNGRYGRVTSTHGDNLMVRLDGDNHSGNYHPWWELAYYDKQGKLIKDYSEKKSAPTEIII